LTGDSKNLAETTRQEQAQRESSKPDQATLRGKVIEFAWYMKKQGRKPTSINTYTRYLNDLLTNGVDIQDPEAVKDFLARAPWKDASKHTLCHIYSTYLKSQNRRWEQPSYHPQRKLPFIPTQEEIDQLIAASGKKLAAALQTAKETAMRIGEISKLKWTDIDFEKDIILCNNSEKNCNPGIYNVSPKLISMLNTIPRKKEYIFGPSPYNLRTLLNSARKTIMRKLCEPRLTAIGFHTLRHWKATTLYHETKNPLLVKEFLRHKNMDSTLLYIQLEKALYHEKNDSFEVMAVKDPAEIKSMLEVGFEYVCQKDDLVFLRKRK
jgi:integrase